MPLKKISFNFFAFLLASYFLIFISVHGSDSTKPVACLAYSSALHSEQVVLSIDVNDLSKYAERVEVVDSSTGTRYENFYLSRTLIFERTVSYTLHGALKGKPFRHLQILEQHLSIPIVLKRLLI